MRLPHPLTLLVGCTIIAAALTHVLPAGKFDMRDDTASGRKVAVAGSYHRVSAHPVTPFETVVAIPDGIIDAASVIAFVFLVGGAFGVVDKTGALRDGIDWLVRRLGDRGIVAIPIVCLAFAAGGAFEIGGGGPGQMTQRLRAALVAIQRGEAADLHGWIERVL